MAAHPEVVALGEDHIATGARHPCPFAENGKVVAQVWEDANAYDAVKGRISIRQWRGINVDDGQLLVEVRLCAFQMLDGDGGRIDSQDFTKPGCV